MAYLCVYIYFVFIYCFFSLKNKISFPSLLVVYLEINRSTNGYCFLGYKTIFSVCQRNKWSLLTQSVEDKINVYSTLLLSIFIGFVYNHFFFSTLCGFSFKNCNCFVTTVNTYTKLSVEWDLSFISVTQSGFGILPVIMWMTPSLYSGNCE